MQIFLLKLARIIIFFNCTPSCLAWLELNSETKWLELHFVEQIWCSIQDQLTDKIFYTSHLGRLKLNVSSSHDNNQLDWKSILARVNLKHVKVIQNH